MIDVKNNYRNKYTNTQCRKCNQTTETQKLILEECQEVHTRDETKVTRNTFKNNPEKLKTTAQKIRHILKTLGADSIDTSQGAIIQ